MAFFVHFQNHYIDHITDFDCFAGMLQTAAADLGDVNKAVLVDTNIHEYAKVNDVSDSAGKLHAGLQVLHFQNVFAQNGRGQFITGITAGLAQLLDDILQGGFTHTAGLGRLGRAVGSELFGEGSKIAALFAAQQIQQFLCGGIGLGMDTGVVQ